MAVRALFWRVKRRIQILLEVKEDFPQSSIDHQVNLPLWFSLQMAKAKQTITDHFKVSTVIYSWNCRIPVPSLGADLANTKLLFPTSIYFSGRICLPCSTADPLPASGTYPAGGGIVQTSRPCAPRAWKLPHGPRQGLLGQATKAIWGSKACSAGVTVFPSSTRKVVFFLPCVIPLSTTCRENESFPSSAFSSPPGCKKPLHLLQDF